MSTEVLSPRELNNPSRARGAVSQDGTESVQSSSWPCCKIWTHFLNTSDCFNPISQRRGTASAVQSLPFTRMDELQTASATPPGLGLLLGWAVSQSFPSNADSGECSRQVLILKVRILRPREAKWSALRCPFLLWFLRLNSKTIFFLMPKSYSYW